MSELETKVWVVGVYNWLGTSTREGRIANKNYSRYSFCDIDVLEEERFDKVLDVYRKYQVDVVSQRLGKGWHFISDVVDFDTWLKIRMETKPYVDPLWPPHCIRLTKKRENEIFEKPIYHQHKNERPNWSKAIMWFLTKTQRDGNPKNLWAEAKHAGLHKYFQVTVYPVVLK